MTNPPAAQLAAVSQDLAARLAAIAPMVVSLRAEGHRPRSGLLWRDGLVIASEQGLPRADRFVAILPGGREVAATPAGRDEGSNLAALHLDAAAPPLPEHAPDAAVGSIALAVGADGAGGATARLALVQRRGPGWTSMAGGRIDALTLLDVRLGGSEEGGPVLDSSGRLLGVSAFGPRRSVMVIPASTIERVLRPLLGGGQLARGWMGVGVQPVMLPGTPDGNGEERTGLMVVTLAAAGPAAAAGLLPGDILVALDGASLVSARDLAQLLGPERVGQDARLDLLRGGAAREIVLRIAARP